MVVSLKIFVYAILKMKTVINSRYYKGLDVIDFSSHLLTNEEQLLVANCTHLTSMSSICVSCKAKLDRRGASSYNNQKAPINSLMSSHFDTRYLMSLFTLQ